ncbi:MAG: CinA family protein [Acutalibacteraceae bacterium]
MHDLAAQLLKLNNKMLAVAESLTGGEICSRLTSVAGISENFF